MNAIVVNCSSRYNIALHRLATRLRGQGVDTQLLDSGMTVGDLDLQWADQVFLSAVFPWGLPRVVTVARQGQRLGCEVHALFVLHRGPTCAWDEFVLCLVHCMVQTSLTAFADLEAVAKAGALQQARFCHKAHPLSNLNAGAVDALFTEGRIGLVTRDVAHCSNEFTDDRQSRRE